MMIYKIAKEVSNDYSWAYVNLTSDIQKMMLDFGDQIPEEDRYTEEADEGLEKDIHVTVKYGLLTNDVNDIKGRMKNERGGEMYLGESSIFECDDYDVVKITVESDDLKRLHARLNELKHEDNFPDYKAHATIAYVKKGEGKKYDGKFKIDKKCKFNCIYFGDLNNKDHKINLK